MSFHSVEDPSPADFPGYRSFVLQNFNLSGGVVGVCCWKEQNWGPFLEKYLLSSFLLSCPSPEAPGRKKIRWNFRDWMNPCGILEDLKSPHPVLENPAWGSGGKNTLISLHRAFFRRKTDLYSIRLRLRSATPSVPRLEGELSWGLLGLRLDPSRPGGRIC